MSKNCILHCFNNFDQSSEKASKHKINSLKIVGDRVMCESCMRGLEMDYSFLNSNTPEYIIQVRRI